MTTLGALSGWKPYLQFPKGRRGRIDLLSRKVDVGSMVWRLVDFRLSTASNLTRWFTAFLGDVDGNLELLGCKVKAEETRDGGQTWSDFFVGRIHRYKMVQLNEWEVETRDIASDFVEMPLWTTGRPNKLASGVSEVLRLPIGFESRYGLISEAGTVPATITQRTTVTRNGRVYSQGRLTATTYGLRHAGNAYLSSIHTRYTRSAATIAPGGGYTLDATKAVQSSDFQEFRHAGVVFCIGG